MYFQREILIDRPVEVVFGFFRDKHTHPQAHASAVLLLEKTTPGQVQVGTEFREIVRMLPGYTAEILSVVTRYDPFAHLEEQFHSGVMHGRLAYQFIPQGEAALLVQHEWLHFNGLLRWCEPLIKLVLLPKIEQRLRAIKILLESNTGG